MRDRLSNLFILLTPIVLLGILLGIVHIIHVFGVIILCLACLNRHEIAIFMFLIMPPLLGRLFQLLGLGIPGAIVALVFGILCLNVDLFKIFKSKCASSIIYTLFTIFLFVMFYILGTHSEDATHKITNLCITSVVNFIGFMVLASNVDINLRRLTPLYLFYGMFVVCWGIDFFWYEQPSDLFDFTFFRKSTVNNMDMQLPYVSYHIVGISAMMACAFFLSEKNRLSSIIDYIFLAVCLWLVLISGARQAIFGLLLIVCTWLFIKDGKFKVKNLFVVLILACLSVGLLVVMDVEYIQKVFEPSASIDTNLNRNYDYPLEVISNNFWFGIGFGAYYNPYSGETYPHNIILEIMCELGFIGLILLLSIVFIFLYRHHFSLYTKLMNHNLVFIIILPFIIRAMISGDLGENVVLFILIYILYNSKFNKVIA